jgi:hypothetical protein
MPEDPAAPAVAPLPAAPSEAEVPAAPELPPLPAVPIPSAFLSAPEEPSILVPPPVPAKPSNDPPEPAGGDVASDKSRSVSS